LTKLLKKNQKNYGYMFIFREKKIETQSFNPLINVFSLYMVCTLYNGTLRATKSFATYLASFFCYESYIGLLVKWKVHDGGFILKNL
jgi:hypothetical protein